MATKKKKDDRADLVLAWHFLPLDRLLSYSDGRKAEVGKTLSYTGISNPATCQRGMHASENVEDAAAHGRGPVLSRVEVWGNVDDDGSKLAGRHRKVLWMKALTISDIKSCLRAVGYKPDAPITKIEEAVNELAGATTDYGENVRAWLESWAASNGCQGLKPGKVKFTWAKPDVTEKDIKSVLSDRFVKTAKEIQEIFEGTYNTDHFDDVLDDLVGNDSDVLRVEDYGRNPGGYSIDGYVLARKAPRKKRK